MVINEKYEIQGMTCASCSAHVTKAVEGVEGVKEVTVNLITNSMLVSYDAPATPSKICEAVESAGYGATLFETDHNPGKNDVLALEREALKDKETPRLLRRLIVSLVLLIPLFYFGMGYMNRNWGWPLGVMGESPFYFGLTEGVLALLIMLINHDFFVSGFKSLLHGAPNMDTLVALGSGVAFIYSLAVMFMMSSYVTSSGTDWDKIMHASMTLAFETAGMVPTLITIGKTLESHSKGKTTSAIKSLMDLAPKTANVIRNGEVVSIPANEVMKNEIFLVRPGESFPVDGVVLEGESSVNEAALTGESMPVDKSKGSLVSAATINQNGSLTCQATHVGEETTLHKIIEMVQTAAGTKTKVSALADKISGIFVPTILAISVIVFVCWLIFGQGVVSNLENETLISYSLNRAISVLVIACPCALGLATPVAIMVGNGKGAKNGILFKNASALEETGKVDFIVLDKTGTITEGKPVVTDVCPSEGTNEDRLLEIAASLEEKSEHPLAKAIQAKARERNIALLETTSFQALPGYGAKAMLEGKEVLAGNMALFREKRILDKKLEAIASSYSTKGKTPLFFAYDGRALGIIAVADVIKEDSREAIEEFQKMNIVPIMLTGDNTKTAKAIASDLRLSHFVSDVLPDGKLTVIRELQKYGKVAMIGDGINDAPALTQADIGIAIGAGADVAIDSADIVLMKSSLKDAAAAIRLSRHTLTNIKENLFWAFFYNLVMIPIAAGALTGVGLLQLKPWYGAAAMALSSVTVCLNALRINLFPLYDSNRAKRHKKTKMSEEALFALGTCPLPEKESQSIAKINKGGNTMKKELRIEGMMCEHCKMHVTNALKGVEGVTVLEVSLEKKNALVETEASVSDEALKEAVKNAGYEVTSIQ